MNEAAQSPTAIVIIGITGDLAQRKLLPALFHLHQAGLLHPAAKIIGVTRRDVSADSLIDQTKLCVLERDKVCDPQALKTFRERLQVYKMDLAQEDDYHGLNRYLQELESQSGLCMNRLFYLSIPPQVFKPIVENLGRGGLNQSCQHGSGWSHLLVEKPFGFDSASAQELITATNQYFKEEQIFRIDHYLAKETAQNILTFRFENPIFEALWSNEYISGVTVVAEEQIGVEGRAVFYEQTGALRDFVQSHLLQLLALTTMEKPAASTSDAIHQAKLTLLRAIQQIPENEISKQVTRGQYEGYREEVGNADSTVETFVELTLYIDNPRWKGVPIRLRTGKALHEKKTTISLTFTQPETGKHTNTLTLAIQPDEAIGIDLCVKRPGLDNAMETASMDFSYKRAFAEQGQPDAYERVLIDAMRGDHTLFATSDEVMASWQIIQPLIDAWDASDTSLKIYKQGSHGPK